MARNPKPVEPTNKDINGISILPGTRVVYVHEGQLYTGTAVVEGNFRHRTKRINGGNCDVIIKNDDYEVQHGVRKVRGVMAIEGLT